MKPIIINQMRGLNTSRARLQLRPGEVSALQNVRTRPFDNWAKRRGAATSLVQPDPVNGIFEWDMDEIVMPCYQAGGTLTFFPVIPITVTSQGGSGVTSVTPDPHPTTDPLDPTGTGTAAGISFGVEKAMRAIQERVVRRGGSGLTFPAGQYDAEGNTVSTPVATQPLSNFYGSASTATQFPQSGLYRYDCYWHDVKNGNPAGTYSASLVQNVVDKVDAECSGWLRGDPEGQADLSAYLWTSSLIWGGAKPTATAANYRTILARAMGAISELNYYPAGASETSFYTRGIYTENATSCSDQKSAALAAWPSLPWVASGTAIGVSEHTVFGNGYYGCTIQRQRGKITADLSSIKSASAACFLLAVPQAGGLSNESDCPVTVDNKWHAWSSVAIGQVVTSDYINDINSPPTFSSDCPVAGITRGWIISNQTIVLNFAFTYN